ncbi:DUF6283 family protein [Microbacterium sp.]|uniref:DUF6283 family protein n=1 Tax=Microbacterium sp. TaxID=51671 RepID=UPI002620639A|nr:DUF6283 family protein [Microbacterium sp.]
MTETPARPRKSPCATCPFRVNVPSGIWDATEYERLAAYDEETYAQPTAAFMCHSGPSAVCAGWLGFGDPADLLAVRLGITLGTLEATCATYETPVPLHPSGRAAAEHGMADIAAPSTKALNAIRKIVQLRPDIT